MFLQLSKAKDVPVAEEEGGCGCGVEEESWRSWIQMEIEGDGCLAETWKTLSIGPFSGANQNSECYWKRVKEAFDKRWLLDPYFKTLHYDRNDSAMSHR
jgi:hypothetical protein